MGKARKRRLGDRSDGRRIRMLEPYNAMIPFIMKEKSDASNYFYDAIEITEAEKFLRKKRTNGYPGMGFLHLFIAAYIRTVSQYPGVNRFCSGQRVYARHNIEYVMTVKRELKASSPETSVKVIFEPRDTINDVYDKLNVEIEKVKAAGEATSTDDVAKTLMKLPRLFLKFVVFFLGLLDYFGKMPKMILKASPFHGSMIITELGSIGMPPIYHHLYNFGNMPIFIAIGAKRKAYELKSDGSPVERKYIDFKVVADERICDGFYFSQAFRLLRSMLRDPQALDGPPETVVEDID